MEQLNIPETEISRYAEIARQIRINSIKMVYAASSGHPGGSLSAADILAVLYFREMNIDPVEPDDPDRDRFILSKGHASPGMYSVLSLRGFFPQELLKDFRKLNSKLEGHVHKGVPGIESSTGSLGQGLGVGVGMALAARLDKKDYHVFVMIVEGHYILRLAIQLHTVLSLRGFFPQELLKDFRRLNSKLEGHVHKGVPGSIISHGITQACSSYHGA